MVSSVLTYLARTLTNKNPRKKDNAREALDALNRVLEHNDSLKYWAVGMAMRMVQLRDAGKLKSPQYNAAIVANAIDDVKIIADGEQKMKQAENGQVDMFKQQWADQFED